MSKQEVVELMESSKSESEWNENCNTVRAAFDGNYPSFWYATIIEGGVLSDTRMAGMVSGSWFFQPRATPGAERPSPRSHKMAEERSETDDSFSMAFHWGHTS